MAGSLMPPYQETGIETLFELLSRLRGVDGCPWDQTQTAPSMVGHLLEEAYELVEAVAAEDVDNICEELGDLLFLLVFVANFYIEKDLFDFDQVIAGVQKKMVHRHPHVFTSISLDTPEQVSRQWQSIKKSEKKAAKSRSDQNSVNVELPALPALRRAMHAKDPDPPSEGAGNDMTALSRLAGQQVSVLGKLQVSQADEEAHQAVGEALLTVARMAKKLHVCPETALRRVLHQIEAADVPNGNNES